MFLDKPDFNLVKYYMEGLCHTRAGSRKTIMFDSQAGTWKVCKSNKIQFSRYPKNVSMKEWKIDRFGYFYLFGAVR